MVVDGVVIISRGTAVTGRVINAEPSGRLGRSGKLGVVIESTQTRDGSLLKLRAAKGNEGDDKSVSTGFLASVNPLFLLRKGGDAKIDAGTRVTVYVAEDKYFRVDGATLLAREPPDDLATRSSSDKPKDAIIYIYRPDKWMGYAKEPSIFLDGTELARMDNGRYFAVKVPPGVHMVHMTKKQRGFSINMGPGETYYFRVAIEMGFWGNHGKLTLEDAPTGIAEIKKIQFIDRDKIKAPALVVERPLE